MRDLLSSPKRARDMAKRAHGVVQERYSARKMARDTEAFYDRLLHGPLGAVNRKADQRSTISDIQYKGAS
jgi:hypothetical protein